MFLATPKHYNFLTVAHSRVQSRQGREDSGLWSRGHRPWSTQTRASMAAAIVFTWRGKHTGLLWVTVHICEDQTRINISDVLWLICVKLTHVKHWTGLGPGLSTLDFCHFFCRNPCFGHRCFSDLQVRVWKQTHRGAALPITEPVLGSWTYSSPTLAPSWARFSARQRRFPWNVR